MGGGGGGGKKGGGRAQLGGVGEDKFGFALIATFRFMLTFFLETKCMLKRKAIGCTYAGVFTFFYILPQVIVVVQLVAHPNLTSRI